MKQSNKKKKEKIHVSYDLWEMHEGVSLYSMASIFSAFQCVIKIYDHIYEQEEKEKQKTKTPNRLRQEAITKEKDKIQKYSAMMNKRKHLLET